MGIRRVAELVDKKCTGFARDAFGHVLVILSVAFADIGTGEDDLRTHGLQMKNLFAAHLVGNDQNEFIALQRSDQCQAKPGIASRRLDDRATGFEPAIPLRRLDHRATDAVFDRAARILAFQFQEQPARTGIHAGDLDQRCISDQIEQLLRGHSSFSFRVIHPASSLRTSDTISRSGRATSSGERKFTLAGMVQ